MNDSPIDVRADSGKADKARSKGFRISREPSPSEIRRCLDYDPETGILRRRWRDDLAFKHNRRDAGKAAGCREKNGYITLSLFGKCFRASRIAWIHFHGQPIPDGMEIDHRDGVRDNNRQDNLRLATISQQRGNQLPRDRDLPRGVKRSQCASEKFCAQIEVIDEGQVKRAYLGTFATVEEARAAYVAKARERWGDFFSDRMPS